MIRTASLAILLLVACAPGGRKPPFHLVLVTIDTLREDALGCYGSEAARTPRMDHLAREGIQFADAWVPVPITLPSHATLLSGVYPAAHGARHNGLRVSEKIPTLATLLRAKGYATSAFLGSKVLARSFGLARGFDVYDDEWGEAETAIGIQDFPERRGDAVVSSFLYWLEARDPERPFFAWVNLYDPHAAY
ncbi:MAG: sulfatase-like hydrolase/transferase, partial [Candidatus Eisenbacteria bacterium]